MIGDIGFILIFISFLSGVLTILAPCVLPILPIIIGVSVKRDDNDHRHKPLIVISAFMISVVIFSLSFKWLSEQLGIYQEDLMVAAGRILVLFGVFMIFPQIRRKIMHLTKIEQKTGKLAAKAQYTIRGDMFIGVLLGPLLQSCSPTYGILLATILPGNYTWGVVNIIAYVLGLGMMLLIIVYGGKGFVKKIGCAVRDNCIIKRIVGVTIILLGFFIITGAHKKLGLWLTNNGLAIDTTIIEYNIIKRAEENSQQ